MRQDLQVLAHREKMKEVATLDYETMWYALKEGLTKRASIY